MHRVFLFGSMDIYGLPDVVENHLLQIMQQTGGEVEFIVGDAPGIDSAFHKALSAVGAASKSTIYCMDSPRNNKFDLKTKVFNTEYNSETKEIKILSGGNCLETIENISSPDDLKHSRQYYEFKDRQMIGDCTFAVCIWDKKSKGTFNNINILKARDKYVYIYTV